MISLCLMIYPLIFAITFICAGLETHAVPMAMFRENRERLIARFEKSAEGTPEGSVVLLRGGKAKMRHETDHEHLFRQESFFHWTFGVADPDCFGAIDLKRRRAILFIPRLPAEYAVWMGEVRAGANNLSA